jgi:tetratricopeptide (TPR) repeat protein
VQLAENLDDVIIQAGCLQVMASVLKDIHSLDESLKLCEQSLALFRQVKEQNGEVKSLMLKAGLMRELSDVDEADQIYRQAYALAREIQYKSGQIQILYELGSNLNLRLKYQDAIKHLELAREMARETPVPALLPEIHRLLGDSYKQIKEFEKALYHSNQYHDLLMEKVQHPQPAPAVEELPPLEEYDEDLDEDEFAIPDLPEEEEEAIIPMPVTPTREIEVIRQKSASTQLQNYEFALAQRIAKIGSWHFNLRQQELHFSEMLFH